MQTKELSKILLSFICYRNSKITDCFTQLTHARPREKGIFMLNIIRLGLHGR